MGSIRAVFDMWRHTLADTAHEPPSRRCSSERMMGTVR